MTRPLVNIMATPQEYFHEQVTQARSSLSIKIDEQLEFYVVNLLCEFVNPEKLNQSLGTDVDIMDTPLALIMKQAMEAPPFDQVKIYKRLGDTSLYFAGFFQESFNRKTYDIDYYISMGQNAYTSVSTIMRDRMRDEHFMEMYGKLAERLPDLVEIVAEVSGPAPVGEPADLVALYDRWTRTHSDRLRRALEKAGIKPIPGTGTKDEH